MSAISSVVIEYSVLRGTSSGRVNLINGMPSYPVGDVSFFDLMLAIGEVHTFTSATLLVVELEQPLEVTMSIVGNNGTPVVVVKDIGGLLVVPAQTTITLSNASRFGYTTGIGVRAITG